MKKKMIAAGGALVLGAVILPVGIHALAANLTETKALEIALKHAGLSADAIAYSSTELDYEDGRQVFEVEFCTRDFKEYDYEIDPSSGAILSVDYDAENYYDSEHHYDEHNSDEHHDDDHYSEEHHDDGRYSDKHHNNKHYSDGHHDDGHYFDEHRSNRYNSDKHHSGTQQGESATISLEEAKAAALKKAGLKASQVTFTKAKQDFDDGKMTYEIEFRSGGMEYEAEIDARTGNVVDWECER